MVTYHHSHHLLDLWRAWKKLQTCQQQTQCNGLSSTHTCIFWLVFLVSKMEMHIEMQVKTRNRITKPSKGRDFYITPEQQE